MIFNESIYQIMLSFGRWIILLLLLGMGSCGYVAGGGCGNFGIRLKFQSPIHLEKATS